MNEFNIYGKDGLFHNITKASAIMAGRYAVLSKGGGDLNRNNLLSDLDLPKDKYPGVFCLPPQSEISTTLQAGWESFSFRLLFLAKTYTTGDNKIKSPDLNTNSSLHKIEMDWSDMKTVALGFMHALEHVRTLQGFRMGQSNPFRIFRVSEKNNDRVSGVMVFFYAAIAAECVFTDIDASGIVLPTTNNHLQHYH